MTIISNYYQNFQSWKNIFTAILRQRKIAVFSQFRCIPRLWMKATIAWHPKRYILVSVRDDNDFEYADEKCLDLAKKIKELIDDTAIYADWKNNVNLRNQLNVDIIDLLYANGYPPAWHDKVYDRVMEQVDNFKRNAPEIELELMTSCEFMVW